MDRYTRVEKPKPESPINENEIRITSGGPPRNYISYGTSLLQVDSFDYLFVETLVEQVLKEKHVKEIVLKAMGQAISKTVSVAEGIKRRNPRLHQDTAISSVSITDVWEPLEEGLVPVEQTRQVSMITITLSFKELNKMSSGGTNQRNVFSELRVHDLPLGYLGSMYQAPHSMEQPKQQKQQQQQPRQARGSYNAVPEDSYGRGDLYGRGRGRGRGRNWGRGGGGYGYGNYHGNYRGNYHASYQGNYHGNYQGNYKDHNLEFTLSPIDNGGYSNRGDNGGYSNRGDNGGYSNRGDNGGGYSNQGDNGGYSNRGDRGSYSNRGDRGGYSNRGDRGGYSNRGDNGGYSNRGDNGGQGDDGGYSNQGRGGGRGRNWGYRGTGYERGRGGGGRGYGYGRGRMANHPRGGGSGGAGGGSGNGSQA
ncbi:hypothetical protein DKX38_003521 [Salix brachista]|uniref:DNA/RNA-binding protein Alba-like domain-containing protein n=1 Tax=Salix brachista TaxID=2182728 RepID=A0A5N5NRV0_9ROSI|nr:hypothetical protein DKX38_003521 [Salix brachista]